MVFACAWCVQVLWLYIVHCATEERLLNGITAAAVQVSVLRNYLGTALVHAYELRHLTLKKLLVSSSASAAGVSSSGMLDLDADLYMESYCRSVMLEWVDALWSCFLEVSCVRLPWLCG